MEGFSRGVERGAALGLKARELEDDRKSKAATLARQIAADEATAKYRSGQLAVSGRNATAAEGRLAESKRANKAREAISGRNATTAEGHLTIAKDKASGTDRGLQADLASKGLGPDGTTPTGTGGAVATPPAGTLNYPQEVLDANKSISTMDQFFPILEGEDEETEDDQ